MFDANAILGMLMDSGMSGSSQSRMQRAVGGGSPLLDNALQMMGGGQAGGGGLAGIAGALLGGGRGGASAGGLGGIAGALLGGSGGRGGAMAGGAMGLLGTLASAAVQQFAQGGAQQPGIAEQPAPYRDDDPGDNERALTMIRAMITAAKADGEIDPQERQRILGRLEEAGADPDARAFVQDEMAKPVDLNAIISGVDSPHAAVETYTASLFAIDIDTPAEAAYMQHLAQGLRLDPALVRSLHESLEAPLPH